MTIYSIIIDLKKSGCNSKEKVVNDLSNASIEDLMSLRQSINEEICKKHMGDALIEKHNHVARPLMKGEKNHVRSY